ncbi:MAG: glycosyl hydrolase family 79 C-terminal domain-containing protein [Solirubrobacteraceae bacterium]
MNRLSMQTLAAIAVACALPAGALASPTQRPPRPFVATVSIGARPSGRPLSGDFLGLALEYRSIPALAGSQDPATVDPVLAQLIRNLAPGGHPVLRIGGQSGDRSWWPVAGMARPRGITYNITPGWIAYARALAQATGARLLLGLGLEADRPRIDGVEARALLSGIGAGHVQALALGNEPLLYTGIPWYRTLNSKVLPWYSQAGQPVFARRPSYGIAAYEQEWSRATAALPPFALAGPDVGTLPWLDSFEQRLARRSRVRIVTWHDYGLSQCDTDPSSPAYPSVANLLTAAASRGTIGNIRPRIALAHRYGASFVIDEMGSISCNGRAGVSDTFGSALWLLDALFALDSDGVDGVDLHTFPGLSNGLFDFTHAHGQWQGSVHPLYYGALMFGQAAPPGSRLLGVTTGSDPRLRAWATLGADRRIRVLLIDDSLRRAARVTVRAPGAPGTPDAPGSAATGPAALVRLSAASAYATAGVTLGGQGFGATTTTGALPPPIAGAVPIRSGSYAITLAPASAALVTLPAPVPVPVG